MSVIVTNTKMPINCAYCPYNNSSLWCNITKNEIDRDCEYSEILDTCPFKSVEGLIKKIEEVDPWNTEEKAIKNAIIELIKKYCEINE